MVPVGPAEVEAPDVPRGGDLRVTARVPVLFNVRVACCLGCLGELPPFPPFFQQRFPKLSDVSVLEHPTLNLI